MLRLAPPLIRTQSHSPSAISEIRNETEVAKNKLEVRGENKDEISGLGRRIRQMMIYHCLSMMEECCERDPETTMTWCGTRTTTQKVTTESVRGDPS